MHVQGNICTAYMTTNLIEKVSRDGYIVVSQIDRTDLVAIATSLGCISVDARDTQTVREISPQRFEGATPNSLSSRFGDGEFPPHTDVAHWGEPARFVMLYCQHPGSGSRPSYLLDTQQWRIPDERRCELTSNVWLCGYKHPRLCNLAREGHRGALEFRFDLACMRPVEHRSKGTQLFVEEQIRTSDRVRVDWEQNMLLVIDNSRVFHSRGRAVSPDPDRTLVRILIGGMQ